MQLGKVTGCELRKRNAEVERICRKSDRFVLRLRGVKSELRSQPYSQELIARNRETGLTQLS
jgi:hypothetical protein